MDAVQTLTNALVVAAVGAALAWMVTGFRRELREDIAGLRTELRGDIDGLRTELRGEIHGLRTELGEEIRGLRSDLTQVALAVGARPRAENE
ncbi:MAG TPA: hypothetical protein VF984_07560 [Actinomycetota bacterium]